MARPKKQKTEWPSTSQSAQESSVSSPTSSSQEDANTCGNCVYSMVMSNEIFVKCTLRLPSFYQKSGPPVVHKTEYCSFQIPKE